MNRKFLFLVMMIVFVCFNPGPALAQWWDGWYESDEYYYDPGPIYYYQPAPMPLVIGIGGCRSEYDD